MKSKSARACAVLQAVSMVKDYDHALKIYEALGKSFGSVDKVLQFYETERWMVYDDFDDAEYWEMIENSASAIDGARKHFNEEN